MIVITMMEWRLQRAKDTCVGSDVLFEVAGFLERMIAILADVRSIVTQIPSRPVCISL